MVREHESAADLTQDTFIKAFRNLHTFASGASFKPWLIKIATNTCLNWIRDKKDSSSLDALLESGLELASRYDLEAEIDRRLSQDQISSALTQLSTRQRHVFILRYQYDFSYEEISEILDEPETTIKSILFRVRERLRMLVSSTTHMPAVVK
jgi:RNA polymerase sigma-70 factor (ECF subfamily)